MTTEDLLAIVARADAEEIESARDEVVPAQLLALAAAYTSLEWLQRRALVQLIQDHLDEVTRPLMLDFLLHSPDPGGWEREPFQVARAIALCHVERSLARFRDYFESPEEVERHREALRP